MLKHFTTHLYKKLLFIFCLTTSITCIGQENKTIKEVLDELKAFNVKESPSDTAFSQYPLGRFKEEDFTRRGAFYTKLYNKLNGIDEAKLSSADKVNLELAKYSLSDEVISYKYKAYLNPILSDEGFHTSPSDDKQGICK